MQSELGAAMISSVYDERTRLLVAQELTEAFLDGRWRAEDLAERGAGVLDPRPEWIEALAFSLEAVGRTWGPAERHLIIAHIESFLADHPERRAREAAPATLGTVAPTILRAVRAEGRGWRRARPVLDHAWPIAAIGSSGELAELLELDAGQFMWLADVRGLERTVDAERLRNYRYRWLARRRGLPRLVEAPKLRLKEVQRWVLREILDHVPAHEAAHGFTRGRSVITHAALHTGQDGVLRLDLRDFFATIAAGRVYGIFRTIGYAEPVAHALTGLCTNTTAQMAWAALPGPRDAALVQARFWLGRQLATPHLPQGAPTSPALANLAAFGLDRRLTGLAEAAGLRYSRYADDLTLSGPGLTGARSRSLAGLVARIASDEGFALNPAKSNLRTAARRQTVTGVLVNERLNVTRDEYDRLRATLHRAALRGPGAVEIGGRRGGRRGGRGAREGRGARGTRDGRGESGGLDVKAHLRGRIAWVASLHPERGAKLRRMFDEIDWSAT